MINTFHVSPNKFEEDLSDIDLKFINNFSAEFLEIPPMVETFWKILHENTEKVWKSNKVSTIIPTQNEFTNKYLQENKDAFKDLSDNKFRGVKARVLKTYPSLIRESHFIAQVQQVASESKIPLTLSIANSSLDLGMGVDLGIQIKGHSFSIRITKTDGKTNWEKVKKERKSEVSTPSSITVVVSDTTTFSVGNPNGKQLFLFKREVIKHTLDKCCEVIEHN